MAAAQGVKGIADVSSGIGQAGAIRARGEYEAGVAQGNTMIDAARIADAIKRGRLASNQVTARAGQVAATQRVAAAASGVDVNAGSAADLQAETGFLSNLDAITVKNNAALEAWGYGVQQANDRNQSVWSRMAARNASRNILLSSGLAGAQDLMEGGYYYDRYKGVPPGKRT